MNKTSFGLDLAGYSTTGSSLVRADQPDGGPPLITILRGNCFSREVEGRRPLSEVAPQQVELLLACLRRGPLDVDVPVDLQGLPCPQDAYLVWELTKRPVDYAYDAMPPLADRIGSYVARFRHLLASLPTPIDQSLMHTVFETYPAASLREVGLCSEKYKGEAAFDPEGGWAAQPSKIEKQAEKNRTLASMLNDLKWGVDGASPLRLSSPMTTSTPPSVA